MEKGDEGESEEDNKSGIKRELSSPVDDSSQKKIKVDQDCIEPKLENSEIKSEVDESDSKDVPLNPIQVEAISIKSENSEIYDLPPNVAESANVKTQIKTEVSAPDNASEQETEEEVQIIEMITPAEKDPVFSGHEESDTMAVLGEGIECFEVTSETTDEAGSWAQYKQQKDSLVLPSPAKEEPVVEPILKRNNCTSISKNHLSLYSNYVNLG